MLLARRCITHPSLGWARSRGGDATAAAMGCADVWRTCLLELLRCRRMVCNGVNRKPAATSTTRMQACDLAGPQVSACDTCMSHRTSQHQFCVCLIANTHEQHLLVAAIREAEDVKAGLMLPLTSGNCARQDRKGLPKTCCAAGCGNYAPIKSDIQVRAGCPMPVLPPPHPAAPRSETDR